MDKVRFGIVGGAGWRAQFYLRVAAALPDRFEVSGMVVRNETKGREQEQKWGVKTFRSLDRMLEASDPSFAVASVPWEVIPSVLSGLVERDAPALSETPPAPDIDGLVRLHDLVEKGAKIQVAEQYIHQPMHAVRLALVASGKLGAVTQAQVSAAHGYHGVSLIRHLLGVRFEEARVTAFQFTSPIVAGPDRAGAPAEERVVDSAQTIACLDFEGKLGVYDFTGDQYFSWIRSPRVLVRGERGEINNARVRYLTDHLTPVEFELERQDAGEDGNLEDYYHKGILAGSEWVYRNPFAPGRLSDDEIAVATCLARMGEYVQSGKEFYPIADAAQDRYLDILIAQAVEAGKPLVAARQPWASV